MGNKNSAPSTKRQIPSKYICPIARKIMVNPVRMISSGNVYDRLSISKWIQSERLCDPISGTQFVSTLQEDNTELKEQIKSFLKENNHYNNDKCLVQENLKWEALIQQCDHKIEEKAKYFSQLLNSLSTKAEWMIYPKKDGNSNDIEWNEDLLQLLLGSSAIPIITFIGASRQGKSTLLNDILGLHNKPPFVVSNSPDVAETKGAWVALYHRTKYDKLNSFFLVDMEGLTNQCTEFTEKTFYAIYAFSDIIVWNDKTFRSDYFENLMEKLKNTMSALSDSPNKPSFLYLKRDKDNFYNFGKHKVFDEYIKKSESFKSFRELNLFSSINGYQIMQRPSNIIPFTTNTLEELMTVIFQGYKAGKRFIQNYSQLIQQYKYINKHGTLSLGTQFIMDNDVLKWFISNDTSKMLIFAERNSFKEAKIVQKFEIAIEDQKFQRLEKNGIVSKELKRQLIDNKDILIHCMSNKRDTLTNFEKDTKNVSQVVFGIAPGLVGAAFGVAGGAANALADIISPFGRKMRDDEIAEGVELFAKLGYSVGKPIAWGVSKLITKTNEIGNKMVDKNYSRYQLLSTDGFDASQFKMQKQAIPLFIGSTGQQELNFNMKLLSLISCKEPIIVFVGSNAAVTSDFLNDSLQENIFTKYSNPTIIHRLLSYLINMNAWKNSNNYIKMFCSLYCIADIIVWVDEEKTSERFRSFENIISKSLQNTIKSTKKPVFVHISSAKHKQNQTIQQYFRNVVNLSDETEHLMQCIIQISQGEHRQQYRFCFNSVETNSWTSKCVSCSREVKDGQCRNCGDLNFEVTHNNEYSFYRQLLYINKHLKLSLELQIIMQDPVLKYFLFEQNDIYQERAMWEFARRNDFNQQQIEETFNSKYYELFMSKNTTFTMEMNHGKQLFVDALSSTDKKWTSPISSLLATTDLDDSVDSKEVEQIIWEEVENARLFVNFQEEEKKEVECKVQQHKDANDNNEMSADREEFRKFFVSLRFGSETKKYYSKMVELEYDNFDSMMWLTDEELLNDIKIKNIHQRIFKQKINEFKEQYEEFKKWLGEEKMLRYLNKMSKIGCVTFEIFYQKFNKYEDILTVIGVENSDDAKTLWNKSLKRNKSN